MKVFQKSFLDENKQRGTTKRSSRPELELTHYRRRVPPKEVGLGWSLGVQGQGAETHLLQGVTCKSKRNVISSLLVATCDTGGGGGLKLLKFGDVINICSIKLFLKICGRLNRLFNRRWVAQMAESATRDPKGPGFNPSVDLMRLCFKIYGVFGSEFVADYCTNYLIWS